MTTKTKFRGTLEDLAVECAVGLGWEFYNVSVHKGFKKGADCPGYHYSLLLGEIYSPAGRDLMEREAERRGYLDSHWIAVGNNYGGRYWFEEQAGKNRKSVFSDSRDKYTACALAFFHLVYGEPFTLLEKENNA